MKRMKIVQTAASALNKQLFLPPIVLVVFLLTDIASLLT